MVEKPLLVLGASCSASGGFAPLAIRGPLRGGRAAIDAGESSQLLTGLLVALPLCSADSELRVENAVSKGYLDLTIDTCAAFGVTVERDAGFSRFLIRGQQKYVPADFQVEGDWSGAAFLVVAAAIAGGEGGLAIRGLKADSSQPDKAILRAAASAGAPLNFEGDRLLAGRARLSAFEFDATDCPDLFPPLVALASACPGSSVIRGIHRLRGKESDRAASLKAAFEALGIPVSLVDDAMIVRGGEAEGGDVDACGDHRIAMAAAIAALAARRPVTIRGSDCVSKSWPRFFQDLASIRH
jgi:3-phosphoshikimate 1-carboxyvinyltransferase